MNICYFWKQKKNSQKSNLKTPRAQKKYIHEKELRALYIK